MQQLDGHAGLQFSVEDADVSDDAFVSVKIGIETKRLEGRSARGFRRRNSLDDCFQNLVNTYPFLRAG